MYEGVEEGVKGYICISDVQQVVKACYGRHRKLMSFKRAGSKAVAVELTKEWLVQKREEDLKNGTKSTVTCSVAVTRCVLACYFRDRERSCSFDLALLRLRGRSLLTLSFVVARLLVSFDFRPSSFPFSPGTFSRPSWTAWPPK